MNLFPDIERRYTTENLTALEAQRNAHFIAFAPVIFQVSRLMKHYGILQLLADSHDGLTQNEIAEKTHLSNYATQILLEASLSIGTIYIKDERFRISKTGWFLLNDKLVEANMNFNHDVNYLGLFHLDQALETGKPEGLKIFGSWPTIYEGLSQLPREVQQSWFGFDHFYSDNSFAEALEIVFKHKPKTLLDVGGNTGRWALQCVNYDPEVHVTIMDLQGQINMMREQTKNEPNATRIHDFPANLLDENQEFPTNFDAIWMSQFLDCFSEEQVVSILTRATKSMTDNTRLFIMETLWDRQKYETAAMCLTLTSVYFTAMANGNSKMFHSDDLQRMIERVGLQIVTIHDHLGKGGHSIVICKKKF